MNNEQKELYQIAVGEMGITPSSFKEMTPEEIELAYTGFLNNKINDANLLLLVLKKASEKDFSEIMMDCGGVHSSTLEERDKVLRDLNIE